MKYYVNSYQAAIKKNRYFKVPVTTFSMVYDLHKIDEKHL